jgi:tetratricopeptide (TPR) repeat protein
VGACGAALLAYNVARFDNAFEFGQRYQLAADATPAAHLFTLGHAARNLATYLWGGVSWTPWFPFVVHTKIANPGDGRLALDGTFGVLTHLPVVGTALAAWLVGRAFRNDALKAFIGATALLWAGVVAVVASFAGACDRYEVEFLGPLCWLALGGAFAVDATLQRWPTARIAGRIAWSVLLVVSIGFSGLASFRQSVEAESIDGGIALNAGAYDLAAKHYDAALAIDPYDAAANYGYGMALADLGRLNAATPYLARAVRYDPRRAGYRSSYGEALAVLGHPAEGEAELRRALSLNPQLAPAHQGLGRVLLHTHRAREALGELKTAQRLEPNLPGIGRDLNAAERAVSR